MQFDVGVGSLAVTTSEGGRKENQSRNENVMEKWEEVSSSKGVATRWQPESGLLAHVLSFPGTDIIAHSWGKEGRRTLMAFLSVGPRCI